MSTAMQHYTAMQVERKYLCSKGSVIRTHGWGSSAHTTKRNRPIMERNGAHPVQIQLVSTMSGVRPILYLQAHFPVQNLYTWEHGQTIKKVSHFQIRFG